MCKSTLIFYVLLIQVTFTSAQDKKNILSHDYTHTVVVNDLKIPWGFVFLPDNSILITEKSGELIHFRNGKKTLVKGLPKIKVLGQGGLLDIALHPKYDDNGWIYLSYASSNGIGEGANTAIMRAKLQNNVLTETQVLYKASPNSTKGQHFGSRIVFDENGYLFFTIGDRGNRDLNPQDITTDGGKVYRLLDNGSVPKDNPFYNIANAKRSIYSYGHRNPQGMILHPESKDIWIHEHGPRGGDEINIIKAGKNYGWPIVSYGINYSGTKFTDLTSAPDMEQPIHYWDPSIAPSGMMLLTSNNYSKWKGNLFVGSLKFQYLNRCVIENNKVIKEERLLDGLGRVRSIVQGPDGFIYVGIENLGIVKIIPKN